MTVLRVIGVDPGQTTGIASVHIRDGRIVKAHAGQVGHGGVEPSIAALLHFRDLDVRTILAVEKFVVGRRASRSQTANAGQITRDLIGALGRDARFHRIEFVQRPAVEVKRWATDKRLDAAGLLELVIGKEHARDAARHALFAAVKDGGFSDPLSTKGH